MIIGNDPNTCSVHPYWKTEFANPFWSLVFNTRVRNVSTRRRANILEQIFDCVIGIKPLLGRNWRLIYKIRRVLHNKYYAYCDSYQIRTSSTWIIKRRIIFSRYYESETDNERSSCNIECERKYTMLKNYRAKIASCPSVQCPSRTAQKAKQIRIYWKTMTETALWPNHVSSRANAYNILIKINDDCFFFLFFRVLSLGIIMTRII